MHFIRFKNRILPAFPWIRTRWSNYTIFLLSFLVSFSSARSTHHEWEIECVDCPRYISHLSQRNIAVDSYGTCHMVYGGDHLYYARDDGSGWRIETVDDTPGVGMYASIALGRSGSPHIAYGDDPRGALKYAYYDRDGWVIETVDVQNRGGRWVAIYLDDSGNAHFIHHDTAGCQCDYCGTVFYVFKTSSGWETECIPEMFGYGSSLVVDETGCAHITCPSKHHPFLYAVWSNTGWQIQEIIEEFRDVDRSSLWYDEDRIHLAFADSYHDDSLGYAYSDGDQWVVEYVDKGMAPSLIVDGNGIPYIGYLPEYSVPGLRLACRTEAGWSIQTVDVDPCSFQPSLAIDNEGNPRVGFRRSYSDLWMAKYNGSDWSSDMIDSGGTVGTFSSIAIDPAGLPHISYYDHMNGDLKYASIESGDWFIQSVMCEGSVGKGSSLGIDVQGNPHISFHDQTGKSVNYAYLDQAIWHIDIIEEVGTPSTYSSLVLDSAGNPHISFPRRRSYDDTLAGIRYAWRDTDSWRKESVITDHRAGGYCSLDLDQSDHPHVSHNFGSLSDRENRYAFKVEGEWISETLPEPSQRVDEICPLVIDDQGRPHLVNYFWYTDNYLLYWIKQSSGWHYEIVDSVQVIGLVDFDLDSEGNPHICYSEIAHRWNYMLKYAWRDGSGWHTEVVDSTGRAGRYCDIALDESGLPHISYYDDAGRDLKYAHATGLSGIRFDSESMNKPPLMLVGPVPSSGACDIRLLLDRDARITLSVFDLMGRRIRELADGPYTSGTYSWIWDCMDDRGYRVRSGTYIISAESGTGRTSKRIIVLR